MALKPTSFAFILILLCTHASAERFAGSYAEDVDTTPPLRVTGQPAPPDVAPTTPPALHPGVSEPKVTPIPQPPKPQPPQLTGKSRFERECKGPVCGVFYPAFKNCEPECEPTNFSPGRDDENSCHSQRRAFDLMGMACPVNGKLKSFDAYSPRYHQMVACMQKSKKFPHILWQVKDHFNHAHFSIDCYINGRHMW